LILADLHVPYHNKKALCCALDYGETLKPDQVIILGDAIDFYRISFWKKDPSRMSFAEEIVISQEILQDISTRFPNSERIYIEGNHEYRLTPYLWTQAKELHGLKALTVPSLLDLEKMGWRYIVTRKRLADGVAPYQLGNIYLFHGHEVRCSMNSVNLPRNYYNKVHRNIIVAHHHQSQAYCPRTITHEYDQAYSIGCLCDLSPDFSPMNNWNHGFAVAKWTDKSCQIENKIIVNGKIT